MGNRILILPIVFSFSLALLASTSMASIYLNVSASPIVQPGALINVTGSVVTTASDALNGINVSANVSGNSNSSVTGSSGFFNFTVVAPSTGGPYNLSITTSSSSLINRLISFAVVNETASTSSIVYSGNFPPFTAGTTFTINITLKNASTALQGILPNVTVYASNAAKTSWTIVNNSASSDATGLIQFNITVPSGTTPGTYVIVVDNGALFAAFDVGAGYVVSVQPLSTSDEVSSFFPPSSTVNILAKVRDTGGNPVTGATVTASVTFPNGTTSSPISLSAHPSSSGYYNNTLSSSNTGTVGTYKIKVTATISGTNVSSSGLFSTQIFTASLQQQKGFFFEWGGQSAFKPNTVIAEDIVAINLTDGSTLTQTSCPTSNYTLLDVAFANGTSVLNIVYNYSFSIHSLPSGNVCAIQFGNATAGSNLTYAGVYDAKVNVSLAGESHVIDGFFSIQNYFLKVVPVLSLGGQDSFLQVVAPGSNITIALRAANTTSGLALLPQNITSFLVTSITPLSFTSGTNETVGSSITQSSTSGSNPSTDPTINMILPSTMQGPLSIKVQATVASQVITGSAFVISNYLSGGVFSKGIGVEGAAFGGAIGSGGSGLLCSGTQSFDGNVKDSATGTAAQGATVVGILQAREADSGKDVRSFLSVASSTASDSNGQFSVNMTFSPSGGYSFSGNYFMVLNATYKNVSAGVPGFFTCKNLNIGFPQITSVGSTSNFGFFIAPTAGLNLSLTNVINMTGSIINSSSTLTVTKIFNFNPSSGSMKILVNNTPLTVSFMNATTTNSVSTTLYPQNFSVGGVNLTKWPNGFFDVRLTVNGITFRASSFVSDTGHGGFMVVPFNAFPETFGFGSASVGSIQSTVIDIQANGTSITGNDYNTFYSGVNNTLVNITIGRPWEGDLVTLTGVNATLLSDGWNYTANSSQFNIQGGPFERWNITYVIPTTVKKGFAMVTITVNGTTNGASGFGTVDVPLALSVTKYNVVIPSQEGVGDSSNGSPFDGFGLTFSSSSGSPNPNSINLTQFGRWNGTYLTNNFGLNSAGGVVCAKNMFNSSRYGTGLPQQINITSATLGGNVTNMTTNGLARLLLLDRASAGVYDTVVLNVSNGTNNEIIVLNSSQRNATVASGSGGLYLWNIDSCGYFTVVNTTSAATTTQAGFLSSYGGSHQTNLNFTIPYVVSLGSATNPTFQSGNAVGIKGIGQQNLGRSGGFGFTGKLTSGSDFNASGSVTTDANGVAFVTVSEAKSGQFMAFWNVTISGDTDAADFSSATFFDARAFNAFTNVVNSSNIYKVILFNNATGGGALTAGILTNSSYNGTLSTSDGVLYVEYNLTDTKFAMSFNSGTTPGTAQFTNQSFNTGGKNYNVAWITGNVTTGNSSSNNQTVLIYRSDNVNTGVVSVSTATQNVTVSICGQGFTGNPPAPRTNMAVNNITVQSWVDGGTTKTLTMYELMNNTNATSANVTVGPAGCALLNVGPGQLNSWPSTSGFAPPVFANGYVTSGTDTLQTYVANIFKTG